MAAAEQIKSLIKSFADGDEALLCHCYANCNFRSEEWTFDVSRRTKKIIDKAKSEKSLNLGVKDITAKCQ